jgi:hypothetical protein
MLYVNTFLLFVAFVFSSLCIGYRIITLFILRKDLDKIEEIVFSFALGMAFLSFLVFSLGLLHLLYLKWVLLVAALFLFFSLRNASELIAAILSLIRASFRYLYGKKLLTFLAILFLFVLLFTFISALAPVKDNDALVYHLSDAKYFVKHHTVTFIPYTSRSIWPYFMQMLFALALLCKSAILAKLFHFAMAFFCALAVYSFSKRYINRETGFLALVIFFLTPGVFTQATYAYIDLGWAFYTFVSFYALFLWNSSSKKCWLVLSAVMAGIAADTKYLGLVTPIIVGIIVVVMIFKNKKYNKLVANCLIFALAAIVVMFPYYIRPYFYTGNPLYPFYVKYIGESGWYQTTGFGMEKNLLNFIISPWFVTYYPDTIFGGGESQLGPLYLAFLPLLLFIRKQYKSIFFILVFSAIFYFLWFFMFPAVRFLLPAIPFLALLVGYIVWFTNNTEKKLGIFIAAVLVVFMLINFAFCMYYNKEEIAFFIKGADSKKYLAAYDRTGKIFQYINESSAPTSKIMLVGELRTFYLDRENIREPLYRVYDKYYLKNTEEIIRDLKKKGITHILHAQPQHKKKEKELAVACNNLLEYLLEDKDFLNKYLSKVTTIDYNADPTQKIRYTLYAVK